MRHDRKIIARLEEMLAEAMEGRFAESVYDETELSRLECRFGQYLSMRETAMEQAQKERTAIKELVTDISHQTKTPLANILLYTELLEEQPDPENTAAYVQQIRKQAEKLDFLLKALVKISRLESGMIELHAFSQPVLPLLEQTIETARGWGKKKGIVIQAEGLPEDISVYYDAKWTGEALGNLLDNAVKYAPEGSTVKVSARMGEMFLCICVEDEGTAVAEEEAAQIFARFYRGKNALAEEGTGVGLYLSRMILQKEGGYIRLAQPKGREKGKGNCFEMYLKRCF